LRIGVHSAEDDLEIRKIRIFLAQEPGQQLMGDLDRVFPQIRKDKDDIDLGQQPPELPHLLELVPGRGQENGDRIRLHGPSDPSLEVFQFFEMFYSTFRDHPVNGRLESVAVFIDPVRVKKQLHDDSFYAYCLTIKKHANPLISDGLFSYGGMERERAEIRPERRARVLLNGTYPDKCALDLRVFKTEGGVPGASAERRAGIF
jgi:hypothetical protein